MEFSNSTAPSLFWFTCTHPAPFTTHLTKWLEHSTNQFYIQQKTCLLHVCLQNANTFRLLCTGLQYRAYVILPGVCGAQCTKNECSLTLLIARILTIMWQLLQICHKFLVFLCQPIQFLQQSSTTTWLTALVFHLVKKLLSRCWFWLLFLLLFHWDLRHFWLRWFPVKYVYSL